MYSRERMVELARSWVGLKESNGSYKKIIDIYNTQKKPPRGLKMQYNWAWCACTWSALAIQLGYTKIVPVEISCAELITLAKKMGIWKESDAYIPKPGDAILYDWDDNGKGDNTGHPDHVGVVEFVSEKHRYFTVIEGNYSKSVKKRTVSFNGRYIRGFIAPKYDEDCAITNRKSGKDLKTIAMEVIAGQWDDGEERKKALKAYGYDPKEVQKKINEILNTPKKTETNTVKATVKPASKDPLLSGSYKTTDNLYCRNGAGTAKKALCKFPVGTKVTSTGEYTKVGKVIWLIVKGKIGEKTYEGFSSSTYLKKI